MFTSGLDTQCTSPGGLVPPGEAKKATIDGTVLSIEKGGEKKRFIIAADRVLQGGTLHTWTGRILLTVGTGADHVMPGDRIRFRGRLKRPRNFGNPGGFDYEGFLARRGVCYTSFLDDDGSLAVIGDGPGFMGAVFALREEARKAIAASTDEKTRGVMTALAIGDKRYVKKEVAESFRKAGVSHILAISGLHMGIVATFFYSAFLWLLSRSEWVLLRNLTRKGAALLTIPPLTLYLLLSGAAISASRAYIMAVLFLLSIVFDREKDLFNTISLAALILLVLWPHAVYEVSFQLTFAAVIAIVYMVPGMEKLLFPNEREEKKGVIRWIVTFILVSLAASLGTAPIISRHFMELSTVGLVSNLLVVPVLGFVVVPLTVLAVFILPISWTAAALLFSGGAFLMSPVLSAVDEIASLPFASMLMKPPGPMEITLFYIFLWGLFGGWRRRALRLALAAAALLPVITMAGGTGERKEGVLEVTFLSVGQGEATFIGFPEGKTMLVDGGGFYDDSFDVGRMVVRPYLLSRGVKRIDFVVMSHPHPDHMNGLLHILREFEVGEVWTNGEPVIDENHQIFMEILKERGIPEVRILDNSPDRTIDGARIEILHPPPSFRRGGDEGSRVNNRSLVMRIIFGKNAFLLTGDLEKEGEKRILGAGYDIKADVIKVPHHGSRTSSSPPFIEKVSPEYALFTVGYMNRFGFPVEEVLQRYRKRGIMIYRTDLDGAVTFLTDGDKIAVNTFRNGEK